MTVPPDPSAPSPPRQGWIDRVKSAGNRLVADPGFQRWAAAFPLTRPIARDRARALFDLSAGFIYSQIALAFVQLNLHHRLGRAPMSASELAVEADLPPASAERLLKAAAALDLAACGKDGRYRLGSMGAALSGAPGVAAMIAHHPLLYADLADPLALLRTGGGGGALSGFWPYAEQRPDAADKAARAYSDLMAASQGMVADQVLSAYRIGQHRRLLDVGGGSGAFVRAAAKRAPGLELALFDLPPVADTARATLAAEGLTVSVTGGDFFQDPLPTGADVISLMRILHDHDDEPVARLLASARAALPEGGRLLIGEPMAGESSAPAVGDAYFGFYLLAMGSGRARRPAELRQMLAQAGFRRSRVVRTALPLAAGLIVAEA